MLPEKNNSETVWHKEQEMAGEAPSDQAVMGEAEARTHQARMVIPAAEARGAPRHEVETCAVSGNKPSAHFELALRDRRLHTTNQTSV